MLLLQANAGGLAKQHSVSAVEEPAVRQQGAESRVASRQQQLGLTPPKHTPCSPARLTVCLQALERSAERQHWQRTLHTPGVTQDALIPFRPRHVATVHGKLADCPPKAGDVLRGVLVQQQGQDQVVGPEELSTFTKLAAGEQDLPGEVLAM